MRLSITLSEGAAVARCFQGKNKQRRKGGVQALLAIKPGP